MTTQTPARTRLFVRAATVYAAFLALRTEATTNSADAIGDDDLITATRATASALSAYGWAIAYHVNNDPTAPIVPILFSPTERTAAIVALNLAIDPETDPLNFAPPAITLGTFPAMLRNLSRQLPDA